VGAKGARLLSVRLGDLRSDGPQERDAPKAAVRRTATKPASSIEAAVRCPRDIRETPNWTRSGIAKVVRMMFI
jgi:hypothetical protein